METEPLTARIYGEASGDYQTVNSWWKARRDEQLPETMMPPLGIIIEDTNGPCVALWCYESFGIGVCFLEFAISRPGMGLGQSSRAFKMAVEACIRVAKSHGDYSFFRVFTSPAIARVLEGFGFQSGRSDWKEVIIRRD